MAMSILFSYVSWGTTSTFLPQVNFFIQTQMLLLELLLELLLKMLLELLDVLLLLLLLLLLYEAV